MIQSITNEVKEILGDKFSKNESTSLRLSKYICFDKGNAENKRNQIDAVVKCHNKHSKNQSFTHPASEKLYMKLGGRLIINQAGGALENAGLCLGRNFGSPYIPGSAVKGCARHYAWELWQAMEESAKRQELAKKIATTFGFPTNDRMSKPDKVKERQNPDEYLDNYLEDKYPELFGEKGKLKSTAGSVSFLAAEPEGEVKLVTDILTCHHPEYYGGKRDKALDNEDPIPLPFPVVEAGSTFVFQIMPLKREADTCFAEKMLKEALEINGIGAKTSAGYGWFEEDLERLERIRKEAEEKATILAAANAEQERIAKNRADQDAINECIAQEKQSKIDNENAEQEAKQKAALEGNLAEGLKDKSFSDIINLMDTANKAGKEYTDEELDCLKQFIKDCISSANKKDKKKFRDAKKDYWKRLGGWLGHELKNQWFKEIVG